MGSPQSSMSPTLNDGQLRRARSQHTLLGANRLAQARQQELRLRADVEEPALTIRLSELEVQDLLQQLRDDNGVGAQLKFVRTDTRSPCRHSQSEQTLAVRAASRGFLKSLPLETEIRARARANGARLSTEPVRRQAVATMPPTPFPPYQTPTQPAFYFGFGV